MSVLRGHAHVPVAFENRLRFGVYQLAMSVHFVIFKASFVDISIRELKFALAFEVILVKSAFFFNNLRLP